MSKRVLHLYFWVAVFFGFILFKDGKMMETGEEGITLFEPKRTQYLYSSAWYQTGTGYLLPVNLPRLSFYSLAGVFVNLGITNWLTQAILLCFFFLLFLIFFYFF